MLKSVRSRSLSESRFLKDPSSSRRWLIWVAAQTCSENWLMRCVCRSDMRSWLSCQRIESLFSTIRWFRSCQIYWWKSGATRSWRLTSQHSWSIRCTLRSTQCSDLMKTWNKCLWNCEQEVTCRKSFKSSNKETKTSLDKTEFAYLQLWSATCEDKRKSRTESFENSASIYQHSFDLTLWLNAMRGVTTLAKCHLPCLATSTISWKMESNLATDACSSWAIAIPS